jgi:hypothetical protein
MQQTRRPRRPTIASMRNRPRRPTIASQYRALVGRRGLGSFLMARFGTAGPTLLCPLLVAVLTGIAAIGRAEADLRDERAEATAAFVDDLETLAGWCQEQDQADQAVRTREWARPLDRTRLYFVELRPESAWPPSPETAEPEVRQWYDKFQKLRQAHADALFDLARQAARDKRFSLAVELVLETLRQDSDHEGARKLLGYQRHRDEWRTAFERKQLATGRVWHERFGWLARKDVARYEAGERLADSRWVSAEEDARRRERIANGWKVETDHFHILTNHSLEEGVRLAARLEALHRAWRQVFLRYFTSEADAVRLFDGRGASSLDRKKHEVVLFRHQDDYREALAGSLPAGVTTTGIYLADHKTAYFYAGREDDSVLFHEATHQLFSEGRAVADGVGLRSNFWVIEGVACYMESFTPGEGYWTVGGRETQRFLDAKFRRLNDEFYVPLAEFCGLGRDELQRDERIGTLYSQAAGLAHFLMHYQDGRYRDPLVRYLEGVYTGRDRPGTLAELAGTPFEELDAQYREFLAEGEGDVAAEQATD